MYPLISSDEKITVTELLLPTNDGVRLYTRYAVSKNARRCPTILVRTPYDPARNGTPLGTEAYANDVLPKGDTPS